MACHSHSKDSKFAQICVTIAPVARLKIFLSASFDGIRVIRLIQVHSGLLQLFFVLQACEMSRIKQNSMQFCRTVCNFTVCQIGAVNQSKYAAITQSVAGKSSRYQYREF